MQHLHPPPCVRPQLTAPPLLPSRAQRLCGVHATADAVDAASWFCRGGASGDNGLALVMQPEPDAASGSLALPYDEAHRATPGPPGTPPRACHVTGRD